MFHKPGLTVITYHSTCHIIVADKTVTPCGKTPKRIKVALPGNGEPFCPHCADVMIGIINYGAIRQEGANASDAAA